MTMKMMDTGNKPCVYIDGEVARFKYYFLDRATYISDEEYTKENRALKLKLAKQGAFVQSDSAGEFQCPNCRKCFSAAVNMSLYSPNRSQKKTLKRNTDIEFTIQPPYATMDIYDLFRAYFQERHQSSELAHMSNWNVNDFRNSAINHSHMAVLKHQGKIVGVSYIEADEEIMVGDYCFYDMSLSRQRSLGTLMDLKILEYANQQGIPYVSFGALNDESPKLRHKGSHKGTQIIVNGEWVPYSKPSAP